MIGARTRVALALCIPLLGLAETIAAFVIASRAPQTGAYAAARPAIDAQRRPGDVLVVTPRWAEPHARAALGDAYFPLADLARADDSRVVRALELSLGGRRDPSFLGYTETSRTALPGGLSLFVLVNPTPAKVVTDLLSQINAGTVAVAQRRGQSDYPCTYTEKAIPTAAGLFGQPALGAKQWICGDDPALNVGPSVVDDEAFRPRRCLLAPIAADAQTVLRFDDVALGNVLRGHGGVSWTRQRQRVGTPVHAQIRVEGDLIKELVFREGEGFALFSLPLGSHAHARGTVEFVLRSEDGTPRPFCLEADSRE